MQNYPKTGKEYLARIRSQWRDLLSVESERKEFLLRCYTVSSPAPDQEKVSGGEIHGLETKVEKMEEYWRRLNGEYNDLMGVMLEARTLIGMVGNEEDRMYLREYYIRQHSYGEIAQTVHVSKSQARNGVKTAEQSFEMVYQQTMLCYEKEGDGFVRSLHDMAVS